MSNPDIPGIPTPAPNVDALAQAMSLVKQSIEILAGIRGDELRQAVTFSDLVRLGLVNVQAARSATGKVSYASTSTTPAKFITVVGDGKTTAFTISHMLGTIDVLVTATSSVTPYGVLSLSSVERVSLSAVQVTFSTAPATGGARVVVIG